MSEKQDRLVRLARGVGDLCPGYFGTMPHQPGDYTGVSSGQHPFLDPPIEAMASIRNRGAGEYNRDIQEVGADGSLPHDL